MTGDDDDFHDQVLETVDKIQAEIKELVYQHLEGQPPSFQEAVKELLNEQVRFW